MRSEINSEAAGPLNELSDATEITRSQFEELLAKIDKGLRALPATAQVTLLLKNSQQITVIMCDMQCHIIDPCACSYHS